MTPVTTLTLFGTSACHLCELCVALVTPVMSDRIVLQEADITDTPELLERYQLRIPVLRREDTGAELDWPFDIIQLLDWLADLNYEES